ncbi:cadherin-related family member 5 [Hippoglossus stenolepis]|uniref:cadherin-related family member 5 n=1 Tax=Hippoglossus stenolepis TaxID=195615 RepID=UPI001FAF3CB6|nr:cadherin-related family member 5 [Hippoglossus stenolepis]
MDVVQPHLTVRTSFILILLSLLQMSSGNYCSAPMPVLFAENNKVDDVVTTITVQPGVTLALRPPSNNLFKLRGNQLLAAMVFDYETEKRQTALITCTVTASGIERCLRRIPWDVEFMAVAQVLEVQEKLNILVLLENMNDNAPVFDQSLYRVNVSEMSPVGTTVGHFAATDLDQHNQLFYTLTSESQNSFELKSPTTPDLVIKSPLDYDTVKNEKLVLCAQDTPLTTSDNRTSFTATSTIMVTILDADNRPPWFQPCTKHEIGAAVICQSAGYTGSVIINEQENGVLPLKPGPLYAIDGDTGINEEMTYSFLSGNEENLFKINANTGNITMLKPAKALDTINLIVLAAQSKNGNQVATTTVSVQVKSHHHPQFQKPLYEGVVSSVGSMAMDGDKPLYIHATDEDYNGNPNPNIVYTINGSSDFSIISGYLFMTKDLQATTLSLQVVATDESNDQFDTAQLNVQVKSGLTTTSFPLSTTNIMTTTPIGESTTSSKTTEDVVSTTKPNVTTDSSISTTIPSTSASIISTTHPSISTATEGSVSTTKASMTTEGSVSTTKASMTTEGSVSTTKASMTTEGSVSTASTAHPPTVQDLISRSDFIIVSTGSYGQEDMIALGVTLGVLLLVCLVVIGVLSHRMRKGKADWKKIYEVSVFRSSLGQSSGGLKKGVQYTNEAFQNDEDGGSTGSSGPQGGVSTEAIVRSSLPLHALLPDDTNEAGLDTAENEKVKPILTKERRIEEGYKAVWFKEDIDPNAKEEVVIIPDRREDDSDEEDEPDNKTPKVNFDDTDLDSGLGVKMGDRPDDSDDDEAMTSDL